ncbi:MAG: hypothetical protein LBC68_08880, partial [Prevotellaceae bacterium]|nr:hypothetical protein [Prevotellaceae bacterium]
MKNFTIIKNLCLLAIALLSANMAYAATITSRQNGEWTNTNTWNGGIIPGANDSVIIAHEVTVNTTASLTVKYIQVNNNPGRLRFTNAATDRRLIINGDLIINTGGWFQHTNNNAWPVDIYGNFILNGTYETTEQDVANVAITMKGNGGTYIGGTNWVNQTGGSRRLLNLTIDLSDPNGIVSFRGTGNIYFDGTNGNNNSAHLNILSGIFNANGKEIHFRKFGKITTSANGKIAWLNSGCEFTTDSLPSIYYDNPCCGSNITINGTVYIKDFVNTNNYDNWNFPNNNGATVYIFGTFDKKRYANNDNNIKLNQGTWYWGTDSWYRSGGTDTQEPNGIYAATGNPTKTPNPAYTAVPTQIQSVIDACESALDKAEPEVTAATCNSIAIQWDKVTDADFYRLYISTGSTLADTVYAATVMQPTAAAFASYNFTGLVSGTQYYIYVKAVSEDGFSYSDVLSATTTAMPAPSVSATPDYTEVNLTLTTVAAATAHKLYRCNANGENCILLNDYNGETAYLDEGLQEGTTYRYKLTAEFAGGCTSEDIESVKTLAHIVLPDVPFGTTGVTCQSPCPNLLVGYVNFANTTGVETGTWNLANVEAYGPATQTLSTTLNYTTGNVYSSNNYTIVKNPSMLGAYQNVDAPGGFFMVHNSSDLLTYTVRGLNSPADLGIVTDGVVNPLLMYCVRIKMRNFGTQGNCNNVGNNINIMFRDPDGNNFSVGGVLYDGNNRGTNGKYVVTNNNNTHCTSNRTGNWNGNDQIGNVIGVDGDYVVFEGCFMVGAGRAADANFRNDDGFRLIIRGLGTDGDNVIGIESIEVYGCLPKNLDILDPAGTMLVHNPVSYNACEGENFVLHAVSGFGEAGEALTWKRNNVIAGTGNMLAVTAPADGVSVVYTAEGTWG